MSRIPRFKIRVTLFPSERSIGTETPYCPPLPHRARALGGVWDAVAKMWRFPAAQEEAVRALLVELYGWDGGFAVPLYLTTVVVDVSRAALTNPKEIWVGGRMVASRRHGGDTVQLGEDCRLQHGGFPPIGMVGGDVERPMLNPAPGTVVIMGQVPQPLADWAFASLGHFVAKDAGSFKEIPTRHSLTDEAKTWVHSMLSMGFDPMEIVTEVSEQVTAASAAKKAASVEAVEVAPGVLAVLNAPPLAPPIEAKRKTLTDVRVRHEGPFWVVQRETSGTWRTLERFPDEADARMALGKLFRAAAPYDVNLAGSHLPGHEK